MSKQKPTKPKKPAKQAKPVKTAKALKPSKVKKGIKAPKPAKAPKPPKEKKTKKPAKPAKSSKPVKASKPIKPAKASKHARKAGNKAKKAAKKQAAAKLSSTKAQRSERGSKKDATLRDVTRLPMASPHMRIGLLGGSFNPAHSAHVEISLTALKRLGLDQVWWVVSPGNPLKDSSKLPSLQERVEAARQVASHPRIAVTGFAGGRARPIRSTS